MSFLSFCFVVFSLFCLCVSCVSSSVSSSSSLSSSSTDLPVAYDSLSLTKAYARSSHLARRRHLHRPRFRVGTDGKMFGSLFLTYLASVEIDGEPFSCIMDTGSSDFAVAANKDCGCKHYYHGKCDGVELSVAYGDGNWTGRSCSDSVKFGSLNSGPVTFAGMFTQVDMLECSHGQNQNGIIGLAYPGLLGPPANYTLPFMYSLTSHNKLPLVFGMQCCGWSHHQPRAFAPVPHQQWTNGALDIGGVRQEHYSGPIYWSDIYEQVYYAVDVLDVRFGNQSISPLYKLPYYRSNPSLSFTGLTGPEGDVIGIQKQMIVDSGTSDILLTPVIFDKLVAQLKQLFPTISDKVWSGDACLAHHDPVITSNIWPDITFTLTGTVDGKSGSEVVAYDVVIPPCRYMSDAPVSECDNGIPGFAFSVERADPDDDGNIMGQAVFEAFYIIHDLEKHRIGFAMIEGCSRQASSTPGHNLNFHEMRCSAAINPVSIHTLKERFHQTKHQNANNYIDNAVHANVLESSNLPLYSVASIIIIGLIMIVAMRYVPSLYRDMKGYQTIPSADEPDSAHSLP